MTQRLILIVIPFMIDLKNIQDKDVWKHAVETIRIFKKSKEHKADFIYNKPIMFQNKENFLKEKSNIKYDDKTCEPFTHIAIYIVSHGTTYTMGNDADKKLTFIEISKMIDDMLLMTSQIHHDIYLFSCQSSDFLLPHIWEQLKNKEWCSLFGIRGFIGHVKGKNCVYVSDLLGGPARYRYQQRLVFAT
jgi:hypothetical protein